MELLLGDCLDRLKELEDSSVDAIVTDPPYGLSFMGKKWDYDVPSKEVWKECLRVLKPGGYLLAFAGTRTQHRMAVNIEDAGFEIRDMIAWVYASGFPKSLNIGKAVDKLQGNERTKVGEKTKTDFADIKEGDNKMFNHDGTKKIQLDITKGTSEWEGWGTALKPSLEPITVARKPLEKGLNVAQNCLKWGVGGINIDGCRVGTDTIKHNQDVKSFQRWKEQDGRNKKIVDDREPTFHTGRFPANLIHDGSQEVMGLFPDNKGAFAPVKEGQKGFGGIIYGKYKQAGDNGKTFYGDGLGSAARFFYCAKASKRERNIGCEGLEDSIGGGMAGTQDQTLLTGSGNIRNNITKNNHPTVKPIALMEYLVKLVSREGQVILDPFMGSGTTGMACKKLNREFIGIEMMPEYMEIAKCRIKGVKKSEQLNMI